MAQHGSHSVQFGPFHVDLATRELFHGSLRLALQDKPFSVLALLLQHPHQLISREQLMAAVWPEVHVGADACLNTAIRKLRAALGETAESARYIETLGNLGYRFVGHIVIPAQALTTEAESSRIRLAVLPFEDLAGRDGSFAEGLTHHVIARLAHKHSRLVIIAPTSVRRYRQSTKNTSQICNELHADYLLTGAVLKSTRGDRVRVDVELTERWDQSCIWAETYMRTEPDSILIQDDIARHIINSTLRALPHPDRIPAVVTATEI